MSAVTQLVPRGTQQGGGPVTATATTHPAVVPPPEEGGQQMTTWLRASTGAASPARQPGRLQQQAPSRWVPREDRARSPRHSITGVRRGRSETGDGPSTRPRSRPRHRPPEPSGVSNTNTPPPPLIGILGGRRRATSPPSGAPERPQQRLRSPSQETPKTRSLQHATEKHQPLGSSARGCQEGVLLSREA